MPDAKDTVESIINEAAQKIAHGAALDARLERPRNPAHGDFASSVALQLASIVGRKPRDIAQELVAATQAALAQSGACEPLEIAGPGFINIRLKQAAKTNAVRAALEAGAAYGRAKASQPQKIQ